MKLNTAIAKTALTLLSLVASGAAIQPAFAQHGSAMMGSKMSAHTTFSGGFHQITHATQGKATLSVHGETRTVKLTGFETGMGPQLHLYLVPDGATSNSAVKAAVESHNIVDLGTLKSIKGNQSYTVPAGTKVGKGASVVVWCDKFDVVFGAATLS